jgi:hypothetical protein
MDVAVHLETLKQTLIEDAAGGYPTDFTYDRQSIADYCTKWTDFQELLSDTDMSEAVLARVAVEVEEKLNHAAALANGNDDIFSKLEQSQVGLPSHQLVDLASAILSGDLSAVPFDVCTTDESNQVLFTSAEMQVRMTAALAEYNLHDWSVVEDSHMTAQASVNGPLRRVRVRMGTRFAPHSANRLLAHEIGGHVLRWANSQRQPEEWASIPLGRTVPTEEGLAAWREVEFGLLAEKQLRVYAARVVAVDAAQREGLVDVARRILPYVGVQQAAEIAIRSKRGLFDPNGPGGQTKDWGYLAGLLTMAELAQNNISGLRLLAGVKWPVEDLPLVTELYEQGQIIPPEYLPEADRLGLQTR